MAMLSELLELLLEVLLLELLDEDDCSLSGARRLYLLLCRKISFRLEFPLLSVVSDSLFGLLTILI